MKEMSKAVHSRSSRNRRGPKRGLFGDRRRGCGSGSDPAESHVRLDAAGAGVATAWRRDRANPQVVTNHALTIDVPAERVWPWLVQMGWHRAGWYTARWVDKLLFPLNWPRANRIIPELQDIHVGDFIPDGAPET